MDTDIDTTREAIADDDMHALHHVNNVDEHSDLWAEIEALQGQLDLIFERLLKMGV